MVSDGLRTLFTDGPIIAAGLILFLLAFLAVLAKLSITSNETIEAAARLPLTSEENVHE